MVYNPVDVFGLSCPRGGAFFVCENCDVQFLGCCASDPGKDGSGYCPDDDVRYSSFKKERGANITDQECLDSKGDWYTCFDLDKPFLGCCSSNACETECPAEDVVRAKLSSNPKSAEPFRKKPPVTSRTATSTSTSSTSTSPSAPTSSHSSTNSSSSTSSTSSTRPEPPTTSSTVDSSTPPTTSSPSASSSVPTTSVTANPVNQGDSSSSGLSKGATAGVSVGATLVLLLLAAGLLFVARRAWRKRRGVVVRGSEPPTSSGMSLPTSAPYVSRNSNHMAHTPSHSTSQSPSHSYPQSPSPSPSLNYGQRPVLYVVNGSSRQSSVSSNIDNNVAGPSPPSGQNSGHGVGAAPSAALRGADLHSSQPFNHHSDRLAELDGAGRPTPELPAASPAQRSRPPVVYRPYRPPA